MPTPLPPVLLRAPVVDRATLTLTSPWLQWFEASYVRQGGQEAATNTELAGGVVTNAGHIAQVEAGLGQTNTSLAGLEAELSETQTAVVDLYDLVEELTTRVTALETAQAALETAMAALTTRVTTLEATTASQETRLDALEAWKESMQGALPSAVSVTALPTLTDAPATADALRDNLTSAWEGVLETNDADVAAAVNAVRAALAA